MVDGCVVVSCTVAFAHADLTGLFVLTQHFEGHGNALYGVAYKNIVVGSTAADAQFVLLDLGRRHGT